MGFLFDDQRRMIRKDGSLVPRAVVRRGPGLPRASHLKVDRILGGQGPLRSEYEKLMDTPGVYLKDLQKFLAEKGHHVCLSAIKIHRAKYRDEFKELRMAARMAEAFCRTAAEHGFGTLLEASQGRLEMKVMQEVFDLQKSDKLGPDVLQKWGKALGGMVSSRRGVADAQAEYDARARAAVKAVEDATKSGATGKDVVLRMREILGV